MTTPRNARAKHGSNRQQPWLGGNGSEAEANQIEANVAGTESWACCQSNWQE